MVLEKVFGWTLLREVEQLSTVPELLISYDVAVMISVYGLVEGGISRVTVIEVAYFIV